MADILRRTGRSIKKNLKPEVLALCAAMLLGLSLVLLLLTRMYQSLSWEEALARKDLYLTYAREMLKNQSGEADTIYFRHRQRLLEQVRLVEDIYGPDRAGTLSPEEEAAALKRAEEVSFADFFYFIDGEGKVLLSSRPEQVGMALSQLGILSSRQTQEGLSAAFRSEDDPMSLIPQPGSWQGQDCEVFFLIQDSEASQEARYLVFGERPEGLSAEDAAVSDLLRFDLDAIDRSVFTFVADLDTGRFLRCKIDDRVLDGEACARYGFNEAFFTEGEHSYDYLGEVYRCFVERMEDTEWGRLAVVYMVSPRLVIQNSVHLPTLLSFLLLILIALLGLVYGLLLRQHWLPGSRRLFHPEILRRAGAFLLAGLAVYAGFTAYGSLLDDISDAMEDMTESSQAMAVLYPDIETDIEVLRRYYDRHLYGMAELIALYAENYADTLFTGTDDDREDVHSYTTVGADGETMLTRLDSYGNPILSRASHPALTRLAERYGFSHIYLMNRQGMTLAATGSDWYYRVNWEDETDLTHPLGQVLDQRLPCYYTVEQRDGGPCRMMAVPFRLYTARNEAGETVYLTRTEYLTQRDSRQVQSHTGLCLLYCPGMDPADTIQSQWLENSLLFIGKSTAESLSLYPKAAEERLFAELGLPQEAREKDYNTFLTRNGEELFVGVRYNRALGSYLVTHTRKAGLFRTCGDILDTTLKVTAAYLALLLFLLAWNPKGPGLPPEQEHDPPAYPFRRPGARLLWRDRTPEEKLSLLLMGSLLLMVLTGLGCLSLLLGDRIHSALGTYLLGDSCPRGFNVFSFCYCSILLITVFSFSWLLRVLMERVTDVFSRQLKTFISLLISVAQYIMVIAAAMSSLYRLGVDTRGIFTGATVLAAVVGFAAQKLVADIMMGAFIVFDGDFRVGDYVRLNGFTGIVRQIGQRNTKIVNVDGSVMTVSNSSINNLVNLSDEMSSVYVRLVFSNEYSPDTLQRLIDRRLSELLKGDRNFLEMPYYLGIVEMNRNDFTIAITGKCLQSEKSHAERALNKALVVIMDELKREMG